MLPVIFAERIVGERKRCQCMIVCTRRCQAAEALDTNLPSPHRLIEKNKRSRVWAVAWLEQRERAPKDMLTAIASATATAPQSETCFGRSPCGLNSTELSLFDLICIYRITGVASQSLTAVARGEVRTIAIWSGSSFMIAIPSCSRRSAL